MIEVIGAGHARTGTLSLKHALEALGFAPCLHLSDHFDAPVMVDRWTAALDGDLSELHYLLGGYRAVVGFPCCLLWRELLAANPGAKVILTERNPTLWFESARRTIINPPIVHQNWLQPSQSDDKLAGARARFSAAVARRGFRANVLMDEAVRIYLCHNSAVRQEAPPGRLLEFAVTHGWSPLCTFFGVPEPMERFPHLNTTGTYRDQYR